MDKKKIEDILQKLELCIAGQCGLCSYKKNCMDGLIDDCHDVLEEIYNDIKGKSGKSSERFK